MLKNTMGTTGKVFLIGAGPGDPGLITVKGLQRLREADVVIYDYLAPTELLGAVKTGAEVVYVGKQGGSPRVGLHISQDQINTLLIEKARAGLIVARLKGGDPFIFGRGGEEALVLAEAGVPFEVIPGVTSAIAVPAYAGIPLTHRDWASTVTFVTGVTGHEDDGEFSRIDWRSLAVTGNTLVILMGLGRLRQIIDALLGAGRPPQTQAAVIQWGTTARQRSVTAPLSAIADEVARAGLTPPAVIVIGEVVGLRRELNWHEGKPLFGKKVLITRAKDQAAEFIELLAHYGAEPVEFPTIEIKPPSDWAPVDEAIAQLSTFDWLLLTSVNGVEFFMKRLIAKGGDLRKLKGVKIGAIGPKTAEAVHQFGLVPDLVPKYFQAEAILEGLHTEALEGKRILLPRAKEAREILPQELAKRGADVHVVPVYETIIPTAKKEAVKTMLQKHEIAVVTFTSSSTVKNFMALFEGEPVAKWLEGVKIACIGPITADTARELGLHVDIQPKDFTVAALAKEIAEEFGK